jgi:general secretion pathway protein A
VINVLCDRALLGAYTQNEHRVSAPLVRQAAGEVYGRPVIPWWGRWIAAGSIAAGAALLIFGGWSHFENGAATTTADSVQTPPAATQAVTPTAPAPAAASATRRAPEVAQVLRAHANQTDADTAFARLFTLWSGSFRPGETGACVQAAQQGLECLVQRGSWGQLRALNRPAVLILKDDQGFEHQVVVAELEDEFAGIDIGEVRERVGVADLSKYWYGDYVALWRPQVSRARQLSAGMRGDDVRWLRSSLEKVNGVEPTQSAADVYDDQLVQLVEDFQRQHRLAVDGIAGVQTQIALDTALGDPATPFLQASRAPEG